ENDGLIWSMGEEIGRQCRSMGVNVSFSPVADLNSNANNPVIGTRSFGSNREKASRKGIQFFEGLQSQHVSTTAKHFPGHGDTDVDSHYDLPVVNHSKQEIDTLDSYPFRRLAENGIRGMMVAHLQVNALDSTPNLPSSLSPKVMSYLRNEVGFDGIVFTDGMDMKGVTKHYKQGKAELMSLMAGADVMLLPPDVEAAIKAVKVEAERNDAFAKEVDAKCRKVLMEKYWCELNDLDLDALAVPTLENEQRSASISEEIARNALTLVRNEGNLLPIREGEKVLYVPIGFGDSCVTSLAMFMKDGLTLRQHIEDADKVVVNLYISTEPTSRRNYGVTPERKALIDSVCMLNARTALVLFGSPFALRYWPKDSTADPAGIVVAYENIPVMRQAARGAKVFFGTLPVNVAGYEEGSRWHMSETERTENPYARIEAANMDTEYFKKIDSIALAGIAAKAYPGCQILVARGGEVLYNRAYGRQTYEEDSPLVDTNTVYDLASLTKVAATTFAVMKLVDAGKVDLDDKLSRYLPYLKRTNKKNMTIREALSHMGRLKAFDAYWKNVDGESKGAIISQIVASELGPRHKYVYSDLGFILLGDMVEYVTGQGLDVFMQKQFYGPMEMRSTVFQPLKHGMDVNRIAPTEDSPDRRGGILRGQVHDPNAAAMGGVAGNAGLFSTATDMAKLYLMLLNGGVYEGKQYLSEEVIRTFNQKYYSQYGNRRALGYDKPIAGSHGNTAPEASQSSFGHTGFTGTMVWADPDKDLVFVFLSNRVYPSANENKLAQMNIRTHILSLVYQSMNK
ncbi:MAG: glycoside hydrolase family 3 N-terminal domain-containing protein, partial [Bacteroidales bacterium]|nr:glycoside hydrolase family 3 N-terminal domain-containing protein [Bacteroidales bacterium]